MVSALDSDSSLGKAHYSHSAEWVQMVNRPCDGLASYVLFSSSGKFSFNPVHLLCMQDD